MNFVFYNQQTDLVLLLGSGKSYGDTILVSTNLIRGFLKLQRLRKGFRHRIYFLHIDIHVQK